MPDDQLRTLKMCTHHLEGAGGSENRAASKVTGKSISSFDRSIERVHVPLARSEPCSMAGKLT
jgi:hypothetical protein